MLQTTEHQSRLVVLESIRADGTIIPIARYREICHRLGGLLVVDETRSVGVYGERGTGLLGICEPRDEYDSTVVIGSVDGTLGGLMMGGYIVGKADTIDCIRSFGSSFIFTTVRQRVRVRGLKVEQKRLSLHGSLVSFRDTCVLILGSSTCGGQVCWDMH